MYSAATMHKYLSLSNVASATASLLSFGFKSGLDLNEEGIWERGKFSKA